MTSLRSGRVGELPAQCDNRFVEPQSQTKIISSARTPHRDLPDTGAVMAGQLFLFRGFQSRRWFLAIRTDHWPGLDGLHPRRGLATGTCQPQI